MNFAIREIVRDLRKNQTNAEKLFWQRARNRQINNCKFLRQHPIRFEFEGRKHFFIADFYCHEKKLIVEIDGKIHDQRKDLDDFRTYILNSMNIKVIRFKNEDVEKNIETVIETLKSNL